MAQIYCVECKKKILDKTRPCPHCDCPIDDVMAEAWAETGKTQAMETTDQRLMALQLMSAIGLGLSLLVLFTTPREVGNGLWMISSGAAFAGLAYASFVRWLNGKKGTKLFLVGRRHATARPQPTPHARNNDSR